MRSRSAGPTTARVGNSLAAAAFRPAILKVVQAATFGPEVIELLKRSDGVFQSAARTNAGDDLVLRGYLLLSEAHLAQKDYPAAEKTLQPLEKRLLNPARSWERPGSTGG